LEDELIRFVRSLGQRSRSCGGISDRLDLWSVLFVCYSDTGTTTTSTSTVNCSPRWIVYHKMHTPGVSGNFRRIWQATTQQQCLDACVYYIKCVAADWVWNKDPRECWLHYAHSQRRRQRHNDVTQFEIVRQCNPVSGKLCDDSKCSFMENTWASLLWLFSGWVSSTTSIAKIFIDPRGEQAGNTLICGMDNCSYIYEHVYSPNGSKTDNM